MADTNNGDIAPSKSYEESKAVQDEKVLDEKPDLSDSGHGDFGGRRQSTALNIVENPLTVSSPLSPLPHYLQSLSFSGAN